MKNSLIHYIFIILALSNCATHLHGMTTTMQRVLKARPTTMHYKQIRLEPVKPQLSWSDQLKKGLFGPSKTTSAVLGETHPLLEKIEKK